MAAAALFQCYSAKGLQDYMHEQLLLVHIVHHGSFSMACVTPHNIQTMTQTLLQT